MKKIVTKCDLCGAEGKETMRFYLPAGRYGILPTVLNRFFNRKYEVDVCIDCLERIRKEAQEKQS